MLVVCNLLPDLLIKDSGFDLFGRLSSTIQSNSVSGEATFMDSKTNVHMVMVQFFQLQHDSWRPATLLIITLPVILQPMVDEALFKMPFAI